MKIPLLYIDTDTQTARLESEGVELGRYRISTGAAGTGNEPGSFKTPIGLHRVAEKLGDGAPLGAVFRNRAPTGEVWTADPENPLAFTGEDLVLTRILWLAGLEPENAGTFDRFIYLHGTNHEERLGQPASHGCIRFANADIVDLFVRLPVGALVDIR
ncbi:MAG: L,D-transpeptidase [Bdellovibrionales bacterium]|nr:L,D-transpeptidase [Bdellovibrionales bacterium]